MNFNLQANPAHDDREIRCIDFVRNLCIQMFRIGCMMVAGRTILPSIRKRKRSARSAKQLNENVIKST